MLTIIALAAASPRPEAPRTFGDWTVACDNGARCTMASLGPDDGDFPIVTLAVTRAAGPRGGYELSLDAVQDDVPRAVIAVVDGRRFDLTRPGALSPTGAGPLVEAMASARRLTLADARGKAIGTVSLTGAAAALRYIDAAQGRAGGVTATVAKGARAASAVPAPRTLQAIEAATAGGPAALPDPAQLRAMRKVAGCDVDAGGQDLFKPEAHALGRGRTLVLLPCSADAYNIASAVFVATGGRAMPAPFDAASGFGASGAAPGEHVPDVVNGTFDAGTLSSFAKGRGIGDCGIAQSFVWDGTRFRLSEQSQMIECRGNRNYITTWRTRVVRR